MMAMGLDDVEDVLGLGGGSITVIAFNGRMSNNPSNNTFTIRSEYIISVFVILKLEVQIFDDFVSRLHLLLIALYLNVQLHLHIGQLFNL